MKIKFKKFHKDAVIPSYAHKGDAGLDLVAISKTEDEFGNTVYGTGLGFEIPEGYTGFIFPRSSISKRLLMISNCIGVIDSGYRGEVLIKMRPISYLFKKDYELNEKICQMVILKTENVHELEEVKELEETERGDGNFGSSDK